MKFIIVNSVEDGKDIYINTAFIGHFHEVPKTRESQAYTRLGVTTHNNGGFKVKQSVKEILKMINEN